MNQIICTGCGEVIYYGFKKPMCCSFCGSGFGAPMAPRQQQAVASIKPARFQPVIGRVRVDDDDGDGEQDSFVDTGLREAAVKIELDSRTRETVGSIQSQERLGTTSRRPIKKVSKAIREKQKKAQIEQFRLRGGSSKSRPTEIN